MYHPVEARDGWTFLRNLDIQKDSAYWFVSSLEKGTKKKNQPIVFDIKEITCPKKLADGFSKHFSKSSNFKARRENPRPDSAKRLTCFKQDEIELLEDQFNIEELNIALMETKKGKSPAPDGIFPDFLVRMEPRAKKTMLRFLNLV